jgi:hypothetical protein
MDDAIAFSDDISITCSIGESYGFVGFGVVPEVF